MITLTDNRVEIPIDLPDEELLVLFKKAHELDMTFNDFIEDVLREFVERHLDDNLLNKLDGPSIDGMVQRPWPYPNGS